MSDYWEKLYKNNLHISVWPWSELISEVKRLNLGKGINVLELGVGMGANIPFFIAEEYQYYGLEASETAIKFTQDRFPFIKSNLIKGDFTKKYPFDIKFDLIFDRASVTHNVTSDIESCIAIAGHSLNKSGYYIGIDCFSTSHTDYSKGLEVLNGTKTNIKSSQFDGTGVVHFFSQKEIIELFEINNFKILKIHEKMSRNCLSGENEIIASYNFLAMKNE